MPEERILKAIDELRNEMNTRFDKVDERFNEMNAKMDYGFSKVLAPTGEWPPPEDFQISFIAPKSSQGR